MEHELLAKASGPIQTITDDRTAQAQRMTGM
jgi:hypothetical protein